MSYNFLTNIMVCNGSNVTNLTNMMLSFYYTELNENDSFLNEMNSFLKIRVLLAWSSLVIILIGIVTNSVSCIAFLNPKTLSSTNIYLASLCVCDSIALLGLIVNSTIYSQFIFYEFLEGIRFIMSLYPYIYPIIATSQIACIYLTVSVSVNQFLFVAFSRGNELKNNRLLQKKDNIRAFIVVLLIIIISIVFCVPYWFTFQYTNERGLEKTEVSKNVHFKNIVHLYLYLPFACVIPFLILIFTNVYLVCTLESVSRRKRKISFKHKVMFNKSLTDSSGANKNLVVIHDLKNAEAYSLKCKNEMKFEIKNKTLMLITVVCFFLVCQSPTLLLHLIESLQPQYKNHFYYAHLVEISKILLIINLSFNFAIFYLFSKKFRDSLKETIFKRKINEPIVI